MFTGLVETTAKIISVSSSQLTIDLASLDKGKDKLGDSISVNGVCLTVSEMNGKNLTFDTSTETLSATALRGLRPGDYVNIERALSVDGRFHGHFVTGHVDTIAKVIDLKKTTLSWNLILSFINDSENFFKWVADKGSISINGVSLTINKKGSETISLTLIPHTLKKTNLIKLEIGDIVNVEFDILSKYIENLLFNKKSNDNDDKNIKNSLTEDKLRELGYVK